VHFVRYDWLYLLAYLIIVAALLESIVAGKVLARGNTALSRRLDLCVGVCVGVCYSAGVALIVLLR
jgi:hypothetical protein